MVRKAVNHQPPRYTSSSVTPGRPVMASNPTRPVSAPGIVATTACRSNSAPRSLAISSARPRYSSVVAVT